jgi:hypothetical protein
MVFLFAFPFRDGTSMSNHIPIPFLPCSRRDCPSAQDGRFEKSSSAAFHLASYNDDIKRWVFQGVFKKYSIC